MTVIRMVASPLTTSKLLTLLKDILFGGHKWYGLNGEAIGLALHTWNPWGRMTKTKKLKSFWEPPGKHSDEYSSDST